MTSIQLIVGVFITLIIGVVLIGAIADQIFSANNPVGISLENVSYATARPGASHSLGMMSVFSNVTFTLAEDDIIAVSSVALDNGTILVSGTDFFLNNSALGEVSFPNSSIMSHTNQTNATLWNYTTAGDAFVQGSAVSNTILGLIVVFFAIAILMFVIKPVRDGMKGILE